MEVPSIIPGNDEKRRILGEAERRAEEHRQRLCRRNQHDRRYDQLGRFLVSLFHILDLHELEEQVIALAERRLLGPVITFVSAVIFFLLYMGEKGWLVAGVMVYALLIHESGHFVATKYCKLRPHWFWFWPFLGALMRLPAIKTREHEAIIAIGGPLIGGCFSVFAFILWRMLPVSEYWHGVLYQFALLPTVINLFNLIPVSPLDGGRITQASHPWFRVLTQFFGLSILILVSWFFKEPMLLLVWIVIAIDRFLDYPVRRFLVAVCFLFVMSGLIWFGYGHQSVAESLTFIGFGLVLVIMCRPNEEAHIRRQKNGKRKLPELSLRRQILWGFNWLILTSSLATLFWFELLLS